MNPFDIARKLIAMTDNGGGTINLNIYSGGNLPTRGYFVGGHNGIRPSISHPREATALNALFLAGWIDENIMGKGVPYIGVWQDEEGFIYVDAVTLLPDLESAKRIGEQRGEIAIWDIAAQQEITL